MSQYSFKYGDETLRFTLRHQAGRKMQRVAIHVESDGRVVVDAPESAPLDQVLAAVKTRARWISQQVSAARARLVHVLPREYVSGETLLYRGRRYRLKVLVDADVHAHAALRGAYIEVTVPRREAVLVRAALEGWFRTRARSVLLERLQAVAAPLRWVSQLPPVRFQSMKVQWGSCSPAGRITLNPDLVKAPRECMDYVLLHELCHLQHHNHSPNFYKALDLHLPRWRLVKERLDGMAEQLLCR
ncbi:MAG: SprT family zinc-dependent metalloprotease [Polaromonas sp.]